MLYVFLSFLTELMIVWSNYSWILPSLVKNSIGNAGYNICSKYENETYARIKVQRVNKNTASRRVFVVFNEYLCFFFGNSVDMTYFVLETDPVEFI